MIAAVTMVRDEEDIVEHTLRHMAGQVDFLVVADNLSEDGTRPILDRLADELGVVVVDDDDPRYQQSRKMTRLAGHAASLGAEWVVPFDSDEIWNYPYPPVDVTTISDAEPQTIGYDTIADFLNAQPAEVQVVKAVVYDHKATSEDDPDDPNPVTRIGWRKNDAHPLPDVACRCADDLVIAAGNHFAQYGGKPPTHSADRLEVRHFGRRTPEQMVRGVRNGYASHRISGIPETTGAHYWKWGRMLEEHGEQAIFDLFRREYFEPNPRHSNLVYDPAPFRPKVAA